MIFANSVNNIPRTKNQLVSSLETEVAHSQKSIGVKSGDRGGYGIQTVYENVCFTAS